MEKKIRMTGTKEHYFNALFNMLKLLDDIHEKLPESIDELNELAFGLEIINNEYVLGKDAFGETKSTDYVTPQDIKKEEKRVRHLLRTLLYICELAGFEIEGGIALRDKNTGDIWK